jgi:hypothetical protein
MHAPAESKITNLDLDKPLVRVRISPACHDVGPPDLGLVSLRILGTYARDYMTTRSTVISDHCMMLSGRFEAHASRSGTFRRTRLAILPSLGHLHLLGSFSFQQQDLVSHQCR